MNIECVFKKSSNLSQREKRSITCPDERGSGVRCVVCGWPLVLVGEIQEAILERLDLQGFFSTNIHKKSSYSFSYYYYCRAVSRSAELAGSYLGESSDCGLLRSTCRAI